MDKMNGTTKHVIYSEGKIIYMTEKQIEKNY